MKLTRLVRSSGPGRPRRPRTKPPTPTTPCCSSRITAASATTRQEKGDLDLATYAGVLKGGGSGAVVVAGNPDSSNSGKPSPSDRRPHDAAKQAAASGQGTGRLQEMDRRRPASKPAAPKPSPPSKPGVDLSVKVSRSASPMDPLPMMPGELLPGRRPHRPRQPHQRPGRQPWAPVAAIAGQKQILLYHTTSLRVARHPSVQRRPAVDVEILALRQVAPAGGGRGQIRPGRPLERRNGANASPLATNMTSPRRRHQPGPDPDRFGRPRPSHQDLFHQKRRVGALDQETHRLDRRWRPARTANSSSAATATAA